MSDHARVQQVALEVVRTPEPGTARVYQVALEVVWGDGSFLPPKSGNVRITQQLVQAPGIKPEDSEFRVTQQLVQTTGAKPIAAFRVTQQIVQIVLAGRIAPGQGKRYAAFHHGHMAAAARVNEGKYSFFFGSDKGGRSNG